MSRMPLFYPMTTEIALRRRRPIKARWRNSTSKRRRPSPRISAGRDVALLCEGDPLFYGSFMHLYVRLRERFASYDRAGRQRHVRRLERGRTADDLGRRRLAMLPGDAAARRADANGSRWPTLPSIMKLGRNLEGAQKRRCARRAWPIARSTSSTPRRRANACCRSPRSRRRKRAVFFDDPCARPGPPAVSGRVAYRRPRARPARDG